MHMTAYHAIIMQFNNLNTHLFKKCIYLKYRNFKYNESHNSMLARHCKVLSWPLKSSTRPISNGIHTTMGQTFYKVGDLPCASKVIKQFNLAIKVHFHISITSRLNKRNHSLCFDLTCVQPIKSQAKPFCF